MQSVPHSPCRGHWPLPVYLQAVHVDTLTYLLRRALVLAGRLESLAPPELQHAHRLQRELLEAIAALCPSAPCARKDPHGPQA